MNRQEKIDFEIKGIDFKILTGFQILCQKRNLSMREQVISFLSKKVEEALHNGEVTDKEIQEFEYTIEEY